MSASIPLPSAQRKSRSSLYSWAELLSCPRSWLALFCQDRRQTNENADNAVFSLSPLPFPPAAKLHLPTRSLCARTAATPPEWSLCRIPATSAPFKVERKWGGRRKRPSKLCPTTELACTNKEWWTDIFQSLSLIGTILIFLKGSNEQKA